MRKLTSLLCFAAVLALAAGLFAQQQPLQKVAINFPTRSAGSWPLFIAKELAFR